GRAGQRPAKNRVMGSPHALGARRGPPLIRPSGTFSHKRRRGAGVEKREHAHAPILRSRLRGSIYSFMLTASRNSPRKVMTIRITGMTIHHHTPTTMAECELAQ